mmetsp:Transcript_4344/g.11236  ORF Transcript_4344/g.11236 Transcript_4344/m.11236 type:complete len:497 (+) Transcript_4344:752-2242(+)
MYGWTYRWIGTHSLPTHILACLLCCSYPRASSRRRDDELRERRAQVPEVPVDEAVRECSGEDVRVEPVEQAAVARQDGSRVLLPRGTLHGGLDEVAEDGRDVDDDGERDGKDVVPRPAHERVDHEWDREGGREPAHRALHRLVGADADERRRAQELAADVSPGVRGHHCERARDGHDEPHRPGAAEHVEGALQEGGRRHGRDEAHATQTHPEGRQVAAVEEAEDEHRELAEADLLLLELLLRRLLHQEHRQQEEGGRLEDTRAETELRGDDHADAQEGHAPPEESGRGLEALREPLRLDQPDVLQGHQPDDQRHEVCVRPVTARYRKRCDEANHAAGHRARHQAGLLRWPFVLHVHVDVDAPFPLRLRIGWPGGRTARAGLHRLVREGRILRVVALVRRPREGGGGGGIHARGRLLPTAQPIPRHKPPRAGIASMWHTDTLAEAARRRTPRTLRRICGGIHQQQRRLAHRPPTGPKSAELALRMQTMQPFPAASRR